MAVNVADLIATLRMDANQFTQGAAAAAAQAQALGTKIANVGATTDVLTAGLRTASTATGGFAGSILNARTATEKAVVQMAAAKTEISNVGVNAEKAGSRIGAMGKLMIAAFSIVAIKQVLDFGAAMFRVGMESEAFKRKFDAVFGDNTQLEAWAEAHHESFGVAVDEVQGYLAQTGNLLTGMGQTTAEAAAQSTKILELAGAWSAWSGGQISVSDASDKLVKGMMGQTRGLIELGLKVTEQEVSARMAAEGLDALTGAEASRAQQQVMWTLIQEKSTTAVGAYGEALGGAYGTSMRLASAMDEVKDSVGEMIIEVAPALEKLVSLVSMAAGAIEDFGVSGGAGNAETLSNMWGTVLAGSAEEAAAAARMLYDNLDVVAQFMGMDAAEKSAYLATHVGEARLAYDQTAAAVGRLRDAFIGLRLAEWVPPPQNIAFPLVPPDLKEYAAKWVGIVATEMAKKWESLPTKLFAPKWDDTLFLASVQQTFSALPGIITAAGAQAAIDELLNLSINQDQFVQDMKTLTDAGLTALVTELTKGGITPEVMEAFRLLAEDGGLAYASELNYRITWATTNATWLASPEHANWQAVTEAYREQARLIGEAYQGTLSPYLLVNPPIPGGTGGQGGGVGPHQLALGGPVSAMTPYLVGEQGPELFMPTGAGTIIPNNRLGGGNTTRGPNTGVTVNIGTALGDETGIERMVSTAIRRAKLRGEWHG